MRAQGAQPPFTLLAAVVPNPLWNASRLRASSMRRAAPAALLAIAALLLAPATLASGASPPEGAQQVGVADRVAYHWVGNGTEAFDRVDPGGRSAIGVAVLVDRKETNASALRIFVNATSSTLALESKNAMLTKSFEGPTTSEAFHFAFFNFTAPMQEGLVTYAFTVDVLAEHTDGNVTFVGRGGSEGTLAVASAAAPAPPAGLPTSWLLGGAAVLLLAAGAGAWALRERGQRRRMRGETRSRALREAQMEERARRKPEQAAVIQQEIRAEEKVRERRRDLQILDAKRADALRSIELLRKRHESGGLTKLQHDNMVGKKRADLARIEAEIAAAEAEDAAGSSAAA